MLEGNWNSPILHVTLKKKNQLVFEVLAAKLYLWACSIRHVLLIHISSLRNGFVPDSNFSKLGDREVLSSALLHYGQGPDSSWVTFFTSVKPSHQNLSSGHLKFKSLRTKAAGCWGRAPASPPMHSWNSWAFTTTEPWVGEEQPCTQDNSSSYEYLSVVKGVQQEWVEKNKTKNALPFFGASQYKSRTQVLFHKTMLATYFFPGKLPQRMRKQWNDITNPNWELNKWVKRYLTIPVLSTEK